jgi:hypothetical protein
MRSGMQTMTVIGNTSTLLISAGVFCRAFVRECDQLSRRLLYSTSVFVVIDIQFGGSRKEGEEKRGSCFCADST